MKCSKLNSQAIQLLQLQKHRPDSLPTAINLTWLFSSNPKNGQSSLRITPQAHPFDVAAFPSSLTLALAKPAADPSVLLQTSALMIVLYIITNFVVPQLISKRFGLGDADEDENPRS